MNTNAGLRMAARASVLTVMLMPSIAQTELPEPVRSMIDAAIATGDEAKVRTVTELARATNPADDAEIDAILANYETALVETKD